MYTIHQQFEVYKNFCKWRFYFIFRVQEHLQHTCEKLFQCTLPRWKPSSSRGLPQSTPSSVSDNWWERHLFSSCWAFFDLSVLWITPFSNKRYKFCFPLSAQIIQNPCSDAWGILLQCIPTTQKEILYRVHNCKLKEENQDKCENSGLVSKNLILVTVIQILTLHFKT